MVLSKLDDGTWVLPVDGAISTHILKLRHGDLSNSVANEAFYRRWP